MIHSDSFWYDADDYTARFPRVSPAELGAYVQGQCSILREFALVDSIETASDAYCCAEITFFVPDMSGTEYFMSIYFENGRLRRNINKPVAGSDIVYSPVAAEDRAPYTDDWIAKQVRTGNRKRFWKKVRGALLPGRKNRQ